jgi:Family of unknown function (DUF5519)
MRNFTNTTVTTGAPQDVLPALPEVMPFLWTRTSKLTEVWAIVRATRFWPDVVISTDSGGLCFAVAGYSMGHLDWDGRLDLPFATDVLDELMAVAPAGGNPGWAVFHVQTNADVDRAIAILRLAYLIVDSRKTRLCC